MNYNVLLVGNPNVGKTSIFNRLTHSFEHVGNWHGVTVGAAAKIFAAGEDRINLVDLPGLYSLTVFTPEEAVARDAVLSGKSDLIICVCEVNNLKRNLCLALQLLELGARVMLVVNMADELVRRGAGLDVDAIGRRLGITAVLSSARSRGSREELAAAVIKELKRPTAAPAPPPYMLKKEITEATKRAEPLAKKAGLPAGYTAIKLLEGDEFVAGLVGGKCASGREGEIAAMRYDFIESVCEGTEFPLPGKKSRFFAALHRFLEALDGVVLNRFFALPCFLLVMAGIFYLTFGPIGGNLSDLLARFLTVAVYEPVVRWLSEAGAAPWLVGFVGDGLIKGVTTVLGFMPQVVLLFFFLALIEDSGFASRVAFMTDGILGKVGLSGRSAFTILMGFGCASTAVLTARGEYDDRTRKKTAILTPLTSCTAKLPVYTAIAGAFFAGRRVAVVAAMYALGVVAVLFWAAILQKTKGTRSGEQSFIMEMPPYRLPTFERVAQIILHNVRTFLVRVGTIIFALNAIVWLLSDFSLTDGFTTDPSRSILATFSGLVAPVFAPLGFGNWRAVTALMSGFVAKEAVVSSIESLGGAGALFTGEHASLGALSFVVFTLLYVPCASTLSALVREVGVKWAALGAAIQFVSAYSCCLVVYTVGLGLTAARGLTVTVLAAAIAALFVAAATVAAIKRRGKCAFCRKKTCSARNGPLIF